MLYTFLNQPFCPLLDIASVPGQPTPLASHQIILSLFFFVSPFMEVISQTAQTFLPPYFAPVMDYNAAAAKKATVQPYQPSPKEQATLQPWLNASFSVGNTLLKLGMVMATIVATLASLVPARYGQWLTTDQTVQHAVRPLAKYLWAGAFLTAPVAVSEGILLARRELKYLAMVYVLTTALLPPALIRVKILGGNVEQVWACFAVFQLVRAAFFAGRIWSGPIWNGISSTVLGKKGGNSTSPPNKGKTATA
jgi:hypothetical protein